MGTATCAPPSGDHRTAPRRADAIEISRCSLDDPACLFMPWRSAAAARRPFSTVPALASGSRARRRGSPALGNPLRGDGWAAYPSFARPRTPSRRPAAAILLDQVRQRIAPTAGLIPSHHRTDQRPDLEAMSAALRLRRDFAACAPLPTRGDRPAGAIAALTALVRSRC
ncbi:MAG: hypothetical protein U0802_15830 [Candidatus Binatia bacterium]